MNQYFFKMTNEEKTSILDQHKHVYDGYVTNYAKPNEQPLYTQDFANDKKGITINNKGQVTTYKNMGINESVLESEEEESYMVSVGEQLDMIGDGEYDLPNGTVDVDDEYVSDDEFEMCEDDEFEMNLDDLMDLGDEENEIEEEEKEEIINKINESLDMFKRLKKYN